MELLKKESNSIRYVFICNSETTEISLYFYQNESLDLGENEQTVIETAILPYKKHDKDLTETYTVPLNDMTLNIMNLRMVAYTSKFKDPTKINIINASYNFETLLESNTFYELSKLCKNFYFDLGLSGIRLGNYKYEDFEKIDINSGTIILEDSATFTCKTHFKAIKVHMNIYNDLEGNYGLNIVSPYISINNLTQYSTFKLTLLSNSKGARCFINAILLYGEESLERDKHLERIYIRGFDSCSLGNITIEDTMSYGIICKFDFINSCSINGFTRKITQVLPGSAFIMGSIATLSLHDIDIIIDEEAQISNNYSIVSFVPTETKLSRKIKFYTSKINNKSNKTVNLVSISNMEIDKIYGSYCDFNQYIIPVKSFGKESVINKLTFNNCNFSSPINDFKIEACKKITLTDCNFGFKHNNFIIDNPTKLNVTGGLYEFKDLECKSDRITKVYLENTQFVGKNINFDLSQEGENIEESDFTIVSDTPKALLYSKSVRYLVENIIYNNFNCSFMDDKFQIKKFECVSEKTAMFSNAVLDIKDKSLDIDAKTAINGSFMLINGESDDKINIKITEKDLSNPINIIDIYNMENAFKGTLTFDSNRPIKASITGTTDNYIHTIFRNDKLEEDQQNSLDANSIITEETGSSFGIINDSPKTVDYTKELDEFFKNTYVFKTI